MYGRLVTYFKNDMLLRPRATLRLPLPLTPSIRSPPTERRRSQKPPTRRGARRSYLRRGGLDPSCDRGDDLGLDHRLALEEVDLDRHSGARQRAPAPQPAPQPAPYAGRSLQRACARRGGLARAHLGELGLQRLAHHALGQRVQVARSDDRADPLRGGGWGGASSAVRYGARWGQRRGNGRRWRR